MSQRFSTIIVLICAFSLSACSGCGQKRPSIAPVEGRVTYRGQSVVDGQIMFRPEHGRPAIGAIGPDGRYTLTTFGPGDGAMLDLHRVTIDARRIIGEPMTESIEATKRPPGAPPRVEWLVPEKYSRPETSPLTAEVTAGENSIDFDLPADGG